MSRQYDELLRQMEREMERLSEGAFDRSHSRGRLWEPRVDICETPDAVLVTVEMAGLPADRISRQVEVTLSPNARSLVITGRREEPQTHRDRIRCHQLEIYYGQFSRSVPLPPDCSIERENLSATYRNGFLEVRLPKRPPELPRTVAVEDGR